MTKNDFGDKLRALRLKIGKSQSEVAQEIEELFGESIRMSQSTISALEQRETAPREDVLEVLAHYFHVPIMYFFEREDRAGVDKARNYLQRLIDAGPDTDDIFLHTNDNSSGDSEVIDSTDNLRRWQPDYPEDEWLEE